MEKKPDAANQRIVAGNCTELHVLAVTAMRTMYGPRNRMNVWRPVPAECGMVGGDVSGHEHHACARTALRTQPHSGQDAQHDPPRSECGILHRSNVVTLASGESKCKWWR